MIKAIPHEEIFNLDLNCEANFKKKEVNIWMRPLGLSC